MEYHISVDNQNNQQIEQNLKNHHLATPVPEKPKVNYVVVGAIILVGFVVFGFGAYYLSKKSSKNTNLNQSQTLALPTDTENNETKNWRIYTDSEAGFSLKYPHDSFIFQGDPSLGFFVATSPTKGGNGPKFLQNRNDVWLTAYVSKNVNVQTLDEYLASQQDSFQNLTKAPTTIGSMNSYKTVSTVQSFCAGDSCTTIYVYDGLVLKNNSIYTIAMSSLDQKALNANQTLFDQILSTFKFLDKSLTSQTAMSNGEKMIASEVTVEGCKIKVTTNKREFSLNTGFEYVYPNAPRCYQFLLNKISPSGNFLVYQSISGGIDSQLIVYSVINRNNEGHNIGVFGSATIKDIGFLPGDKLVALMGIPGDFETWSLFSLNLTELYKNYPNNYGKDNVDMFTDTESVEKTTMLPNKNKDYNGFSIDADKVHVNTVGPKTEFVEYNIGDL